MRRGSWYGVLAAALGTVIAGAVVVPASAANLVWQSSVPVDGSTVAPPAPSTLSSTYNGALDLASASVTLRDAGNGVVTTTAPALSNSNRTVSVAPAAQLIPGSYTVTFDVQNAALDSHPTPKVIAFTVSNPAPAAPTSVSVDAPATATDTVVVVSGGGVSGNTINVGIDDDANVATTPVTPGSPVTVVNNLWSASVDVATLDDGTLTATVSQSNGTATSSEVTATVLKDATAPAAPTAVAFDGPAKVGDTSVVLSGDGETGATLSFSVDDTNGGTTALTGTTSVVDGHWSTTLDVASLDDGTLTATVTQTDGVGNVSAEATTIVLKDMSAPGAPTEVVFDAPATVTDTQVLLSGHGETGATVSYSVDDSNGGTSALTGTASVVAGDWSVSIDVMSLADGTLTATVTQADGVGNASPEETATVVKDATPPGAPSGVGFDAPAKSGDTSVLLSGAGDNGETISYRVDDANDAIAAVTGTTSVTDGQWSVSVEVASLDDGTLTATVKQVDGVGNESSAATATVAKDVVVPAAPSGMQFDGPANAADTDVVLSGNGETGATVTISVDDGNSETPAVTDTKTVVSGQWTSAVLDVSGLDDGTLTATVTQTDGVGNESTPGTKTVLKDIVAPGVPASLLFDGPANQADTAVVLSGAGESGATVSFTIDDGNANTPSIPGNANVVNGQWSSGPVDVFALSDGTLTATATQTDLAGNPSGVSSEASTAKDTGVPAAPTGLDFDGVVKGSDTVVVLSGAGENGAIVSIEVNDTDNGTPAFVRQATVSGGTWSKGMDLAALTDGTLTATVTQSDVVGNESSAATKNVLKDTIALPPSPAFDHPANDANNGLVHLEGTGEPGADVEVRVNDEADGTPVVLPNNDVVVDVNGFWSAELYLSSLQDGTITGRARQTDKRGNVSPWAEATTIKDTSKPPAPTITGPTARWTIGLTRVSWEGKTARYDVGFLEAVSGGRLGSNLQLPSSMQNIKAKSLLRSQPLGTTDCYQVRAHDAAGNRSFWSAQRCSTRPFDDRKLNPSGSWTKRTGDQYWQGTVRRTKSKGAALALGKTTVQRIALVATTCDTCGRIAVSVGGTRVAVFDLHSNRVRHRQLLTRTLTSLPTGRVVLTTLSRRLVEVDGFGVTRV
jgi:methionine-rich copper-binding protein CopC